MTIQTEPLPSFLSKPSKIGDEISITGSTIDAGNENVANAVVNAAANKVWAMLVQVTIQ